jgi:hypothetical protein
MNPRFSGPGGSVIDLSTLIALLTALASATSPQPPDSSARPPDPPSRSCAAPAPDGRASLVLDDSLDRPTASPRAGSSATRARPSDSAASDDDDRTDGRPDQKSPDRKDADQKDADDDSAAEGSDTGPGDEPSAESGGERDRGESPRTPRPGDDADRPPTSDRRSGSTAGDEPVPGRSGSSSTTRPRGSGCGDDRFEPGRPRPQVPGDLVDLANWYLTLPTGADGDPDTVQPDRLGTYSSTYFEVNRDEDGVVFTAPVDGVTTRNSAYPRSELREMNGEQEAEWSNGSGTHTLRATEAVTELPPTKPEVVTAQIHGGDDDVMQIRLEGSRLMVQYADGAKQVTLDPDYRLGTPYDIEIVAAENSVRISYNGTSKADLPLSGSTWYFKAGAYVQSNPTKGDAATAAGQVIIYKLEVTHDGTGPGRPSEPSP